MNLQRILLRMGGAFAAFVAASTPAYAGFMHYYYDAQGRLLGALGNAHEMRTSKTDNADNPTYLHAFPVAGRSVASTLPVYGALLADQYLTSSDGRFTFNIQEDGNAVVYEDSTVLWSTGTTTANTGKQPGWFTLGGDGNLAYFDPSDNLLWRTNITNSTGTNAQLIMQSTGDLELFQNGVMVWNTNTGGH